MTDAEHEMMNALRRVARAGAQLVASQGYCDGSLGDGPYCEDQDCPFCELARAVDAAVGAARSGLLTVFNGAPGVRDVNAPCNKFTPGKPRGLCSGDGHHLCRECRNWEGGRD